MNPSDVIILGVVEEERILGIGWNRIGAIGLGNIGAIGAIGARRGELGGETPGGEVPSFSGFSGVDVVTVELCRRLGCGVRDNHGEAGTGAGNNRRR